jgi:hypothetical protein
MATAYCFKCKCKREATDSEYVTTKRSVVLLKGKCVICGTKMCCAKGKAE